MKIFPRPLSLGARVAVIAPSSPASDESLASGLGYLREMGFEPIVGRSCRDNVPERGYLAAESDAIKIDDIHWAFSDESIDGIFCMKGGSGAGRLIRYLDAALIALHPKVFVGYSDITILHSFIASQCGFVTYHGPMVTSSSLSDGNGYTRRALMRAIAEEHSGDSFVAVSNPDGCTFVPVARGVASGELVGGNLAVLCTTLGTVCEVDTAGRVVLLEDVDEEPYSVDRMLNHLLNAGKLADAAGILLGEFTGCEPPEKYRRRRVEDIVRDVLVPLGIPILGGLRSGHGTHNVTLPLGACVELDADFLSLRVKWGGPSEVSIR